MLLKFNQCVRMTNDKKTSGRVSSPSSRRSLRLSTHQVTVGTSTIYTNVPHCHLVDTGLQILSVNRILTKAWYSHHTINLRLLASRPLHVCSTTIRRLQRCASFIDFLVIIIYFFCFVLQRWEQQGWRWEHKSYRKALTQDHMAGRAGDFPHFPVSLRYSAPESLN